MAGLARARTEERHLALLVPLCGIEGYATLKSANQYCIVRTGAILEFTREALTIKDKQ